MADLSELQSRLSDLRRARASGVASVSYSGKEVTYKTDAQMAEAIADLEGQIAAMSGRPVRIVRFASGKGV